jgi:stage II sporulation protein D
VRRLLTPLTAIAAAACLAAALAPSARADGTLTITGHGDGHGVGLAQWGAFGMASQGATAAQILAHYYTGTAVGAAPTRRVRVLLVGGRATVRIAGGVRAGTRRIPKGATVTARSNGTGGVLLQARGRTLVRSAGPLRISPGAHGTSQVLLTAGNGVKNGRWRGVIVLRPNALGRIDVIDDVGLEDYVRGVVAGESPPSWPAAALQAQAIAARGYAITTSVGGVAGAFDLYSDTRSQVYGGVAAETPQTDAAVAATRNQVVTYAGAPIVSYFSASSGGRTEDVEDAFPGAAPEPYLVAVDDPADAVAPDHDWTVTLSLAQAQRRLGGLVDGTLEAITPSQTSPASPRVLQAQITGTGGTTTATGAQLRARLGLPSTWATFAVAPGSR